jgi:hypothetical protein
VQLGVKFISEFRPRNPDVERGASGSAALNLLIKLLRRQTNGRIRLKPCGSIAIGKFPASGLGRIA